MKNTNFVDSLNRAIEGFLHTLRFQRNMRIHFIFAISVIILGIILNFSSLELAILIFTIALVLFAEMVNTIIESLLDFYKNEPDHLIKIVKDISAGSVLLVSVSALGIGYLLFFRRIQFPLESLIISIKQSDWHVSFIILLLLISLVIIIKYLLQRGSPLHGGLPSGHTAFAFSIWTLTLILQKNKVINILVLILAILIARSRVRMGVHNLYEIIIGALLGIIFTIFVYQLLLLL